jgi:hypothetical protein
MTVDVTCFSNQHKPLIVVSGTQSEMNAHSKSGLSAIPADPPAPNTPRSLDHFDFKVFTLRGGTFHPLPTEMRNIMKKTQGTTWKKRIVAAGVSIVAVVGFGISTTSSSHASSGWGGKMAPTPIIRTSDAPASITITPIAPAPVKPLSSGGATTNAVSGWGG